MSFYRELKGFILELKGEGFMLSPRDRLFLKHLEESGYPIELVREALRRFFLSYPPERRKKLPLSMCRHELERLKKHYIKKETAGDWREKFRQKLELAEKLLGENLLVEEPEDPARAEELLEELEKRVAKRLWEGLEEEEKKSLLRKYATFKGDEELFKLLIRRELLKRAGIKSLSLFLD